MKDGEEDSVTTQEEHSLYILTESSRLDTGWKYQTVWHRNQSRDWQDKPGGAHRSMHMHEQVSKVSRAHPAHRSVHEQVSKVSRAHCTHKLSTI